MSRWMEKRIFAHCLFLAFALIRNPHAIELLHLDFNDSANLGSQTGPLPLGMTAGDAKPTSLFPGSIEFGQAGGSIRIPGFRSPTGPFTVEARFRIREYGSGNSNYIANLLNTVPEFHQGLAFRVGGGYLYPPLPRNAYKSESEWLTAQNAFSPVSRERISDCFAVFVMAGDGGKWMEVYTDRCVEKNAWTHLVGTWDGDRMRIYLNGSDATDSWRTQGPEASPILGDTVDAFVGSRTSGDFDPRHLKGVLDYVKVEEGSISENEIHKRYKGSFVPEVRDSLCMGVVVPKYPEAGQLCKGKLDFEFKIINHGACTDPAFLAAFLAGDSVEVEISKDASFTDIILHAVVAGMSLHLDAANLPGLEGYQGALYWRVRLVHPKRGALAKSAANTPGDWSLARPLIVDMSGTSAIRARDKSLKHVLIQAHEGLFVADNASASAPALFNLAGKRQSARFQRVAGGWKLGPENSGLSGLFYIR